MEDFNSSIGTELDVIESGDDEGLKTMTETPEDVQGYLPGSVTLVGLLVEVGEGVGTVIRAVDDLAAELVWEVPCTVLPLVVRFTFCSNVIEVLLLCLLHLLTLVLVGCLCSQASELYTLATLGEP